MKQHESAISLKERINSNLARNWKWAALILALMIAGLIATLTLYKVDENLRKKSSMLAEDIQDLYSEWAREEAEDRDSEELDTLIDKALSEHSRRFAAQRALFTRGLMAIESEEWEAAAADFQMLADRWEKSHLAPVSLFNAASALEQAGNLEGAKEAWTAVAETYGDTSPDASEALFNLGRLAEAAGDAETALKRYGEIGSRFPESRWTDISKNRILVIESSN